MQEISFQEGICWCCDSFW